MSAKIPVAIVGLGCKFPKGCNDKETYYEFLRNKGDGMVPPPASRWNHKKWFSERKDEPGKYCAPTAGFVDDIDMFDPTEFGISVKEAQLLDPSLRLSLEVAHQALHDSGAAYRGTNTGVYLAQLLTSTAELEDDPYEIDHNNGVGKCVAIRANRISYTFNLQGPSLVIDTACSSSGTAMHLALQAIRLGEIDQALVVGASTMVNPEHTVSFSKLGVLSATGSSKSFDAAGDGYARSEGYAAVLVKRLDHAIRDGDRIYSVIAGSAINTNGKGKSLTMPEGDMQAEVIRTAYRRAERDPAEAFFVELHATGTVVGDPIETNGAAKVFAPNRDQSKTLRIGSVKGNIGHAEGCSFLASLIKVTMMMHQKEIIPNYRFNSPNKKIDLKALNMRVQTELEPMTPELAAADGKWVASVSSYGVGGANAHLVLETFESAQQMIALAAEPDSIPMSVAQRASQEENDTSGAVSEKRAADPHYLFSIGTMTASSLTQWGKDLGEHFASCDDADVLRSLSRSLGRQARDYPYRSFAVGKRLDTSLSFSKPALSTHTARASKKLCLVFAGQGPQHVAMGKELAAAFPEFLASVRQSDEILTSVYGQESFIDRTGVFDPNSPCKLPANGVWPVRDVVFSLVFMQCALVDLLRAKGVATYEVCMGHSIGEIAMGYASGHYPSKEMVVGIAVARAAAMTHAEGNGAMAALGTSAQQARLLIRKVLKQENNAENGHKEDMWIAGINSPNGVTVAGTHHAIDALVAHAKNASVFAAKLRVTCAFHTPLMSKWETLFKNNATPVFAMGNAAGPCSRVMSTVTGDWVDELNLELAWQNIESPVLFGPALKKVIDEYGEDIAFLEIAPHPVLKAYIEQCGGSSPINLVRRPDRKNPASNTGEDFQFLEGLGQLISSGYTSLDFDKLCALPSKAQEHVAITNVADFVEVALPPYPYTSKRSCWKEDQSAYSRKHQEDSLPLGAPHFRLSVSTHPALVGHTVMDSVLFPGSGYVEAVLQNQAMVVKDVIIGKALVLPDAESLPIHVACAIEGDKFQFKSATNQEFKNGDVVFDTVHASGCLAYTNPALDKQNPPTADIQKWLGMSTAKMTGDQFHGAIPKGYNYTGSFRDFLAEVHQLNDPNSWGGTSYLGKFSIKQDYPDLFDRGYVLHPGILDSMTQIGLAMFIQFETLSFDMNGLFVPVKIGCITRWEDSKSIVDEVIRGKDVYVHFHFDTWSPDGPYVASYTIALEDGRVLLTMEDFEIARLPTEKAVCVSDANVKERLTTCWQAKEMILPETRILSLHTDSLHATAAATVKEIIAHTVLLGQRKALRIADLSPDAALAKALDPILLAVDATELSIEYTCAAGDAETADAKSEGMKYANVESGIFDPISAEETTLRAGSYDIVLHSLDIVDLGELWRDEVQAVSSLLVPGGCLLAHVPGKVSPCYRLLYNLSNPLTLLFIPGIKVDLLNDVSSFFKRTEDDRLELEKLDDGSHLLVFSRPAVPIEFAEASPEDTNGQVTIFHMHRGNEGELAEAVKVQAPSTELYIVGNDDAAGIGALGVAACFAAEQPEFTVRSILFEDQTLSEQDRNALIYSLRKNPELLEQHMRLTKDGKLTVRRLVPSDLAVKQPDAEHMQLVRSAAGNWELAAYFPQPVISSEDHEFMQVKVDAVSVGSNVGSTDNVFGFVTKDIVGIATSSATRPIADVVYPRIAGVARLDGSSASIEVAALLPALLPIWIAFVEQGLIRATDSFLIANAHTTTGYLAVQLAKRLAPSGQVFCTVDTLEQAQQLARDLEVEPQSILLNRGPEEASRKLKAWLKANRRSGFDHAVNTTADREFVANAAFLTPAGRYVHVKRSASEEVRLPATAAATVTVSLVDILKYNPEAVAQAISKLVAAHQTTPFRFPVEVTSFEELPAALTRTTDFAHDTIVATMNPLPAPQRVNTTVQIFDPIKTYLLVGGCSELGVRMSHWMIKLGARNIFLTSRRGERALTKVDRFYVHHFRELGVRVELVAADALSEEHMKGLVDDASAVGPIGGIFMMAVILRDSILPNLTNEDFETVWGSKVGALNVLLSVMEQKINDIDFLLLFSSIAAVTGNAGQSAYVQSQLYLDRIAEELPNTVSMAFPAITDVGVFRRMLERMAATGSKAGEKLSKMGMTTDQVCNFVGDAIAGRRIGKKINSELSSIAHYVPMLATDYIPITFPTCEPLFFSHLLGHRRIASSGDGSGQRSAADDTVVGMISGMLGLEPSQLTEEAPLTSFGIDSLAASNLSSKLKMKFGIAVSQIQLLGRTSIADLNTMIAAVNVSTAGSDSKQVEDVMEGKYGAKLEPLLNDKLVYGQAHVTEASAHQYRIWVAQAEAGNGKKLLANADKKLSRFGATQWDTHEGYYVLVAARDGDLDDHEYMLDAFNEVVQRHGALRTKFTWDEKKGKLMQTIYPFVEFEPEFIDLSMHADAEDRAYKMSVEANYEPNFKLDSLPLLKASLYKVGSGRWAINVIIHHIIMDEVSMAIFFSELTTIYINRTGSVLKPLDIHFSDFSDWQARTADARALLRDDQLAFWKAELKDARPLHLPLAKRSEVAQSSVTQVELLAPHDVVQNFANLGAQLGLTKFATFFAAYNILLYKYSSQRSFCVGTMVTDRGSHQLTSTIGFFANILPIGVTIDENMSVTEYMSAFRDNFMACMENKDVTYEDIVGSIRRGSGERGLFKHLFSAGGIDLNAIRDALAGHHIDIERLEGLPNPEEKYELLLTAIPDRDAFVLRFNHFMFSDTTAQQFLQAYVSLLEVAASNPDVKIVDIPAISASERDRLINEWSSEGEVDPVEGCVHVLFEEQVILTPDAVAVTYEDQSMTYAELNALANRAALFFNQQGVKAGSIVALSIDRGISQIVSLLAVLKCGGAFVPLDPDDPPARTEALIKDVGAKILLTSTARARLLERRIASQALVVRMDDEFFLKRISRLPAEDLEMEIAATDLAYICFTSGSSGKPKGVMVPHRALSNLVRHSNVYGYHEGARVLSSLSYTFDPFMVDVFGTLACGATLCMGRKELVLGDIGTAITQLKINVLHLTPSILATVPVADYPTLETVVVAGEKLSRAVIEKWCKRTRLMNMFGPTETTVDVICAHIDSVDLSGVIGRPMANCRAYILDSKMNPVPIGCEGELYIGGIQVASGYFADEERTAESFIPSPFVKGERLYKTGDIASYRPDGNIEYIGRRDFQIKLRGQRIELGEIEDTIQRYEHVQRCAAVARPIHDEQAVVAFVEFKNTTTEVDDELNGLKEHMSSILPRFLIPSLLLALPQMPCTSSGKIDRKQLMAMDLTSLLPTNDAVSAPESSIETDLIDVFATLLDIDPSTLGTHHDLFSHGLNSLLAVQAAEAITKKFNVHVGLNNLYIRSSVHDLAAFIIDQLGRETRQIQEAEDSEQDFLIELLPIKKKGILPRLFIIHDVTGMATPFMRLGAFIPNEIYAIGDKHFGQADGFDSINEMADHYITLIRSVQPLGPYVISGYSFGGNVAICVARKLQDAGETVQHLILFDSICIPRKERMSLKATDWTAGAIDRISENFPDISESWMNRLRTEIGKNIGSLFDYEPPARYEGLVTLVVPKDRAWFRTGRASDFDTGMDDYNGWGARCENIQLRVSAGRHDTMFAPAHVKSAATVLKELLAETPTAPTPVIPAREQLTARHRHDSGLGGLESRKNSDSEEAPTTAAVAKSVTEGFKALFSI
ncbi:putative nonribosomal peptide synthetase [Fimicolochytrium jonesii]|uniref:putative nonribosomal peptide synthetase n=1 Tax=Fimicolochytrium jonesii TaxID=1396493 RepID=UPI0022FE078A|nr:putative nonribosomal peptide synthetase [Fimicolochytrium jonesii]KAI8820281.1 putative nonribosomal peptide synthetase [Fimicolochytrium jonesii]